ncbi:hypothetical protein [Marinoscillum sp. MHG1-6]|uniref:hypothetical protein n=1 Tax=Marinoscillum sp. MHG1-6 TaxID=2959627 RepID=UPI002157E10D|nr:hypothetical protein [Marinoscillum sp. MHG1-6]
MILRSILFFTFILIFILLTEAQTTRDVEPIKPPAPAYQSQKKQEKNFFSRIFQKENSATYDEDVIEFRERMKDVQKKKKKEAKLAEKPQYSNPLYFGHKKPPKKRPVGKRKFCDECGLVH